jgi:radical SAM protein with 4Fe4S-binding SPASM domain
VSLPLPDHFVVELTTRCNHDCLHCYNCWKGPGSYPAGELSTTDTLALIERLLAETGARLLTLTGGEPLLRQDVFEIIEHLHAQGIALNLISNGSLLTEAVIDRLCPDRISIFELPLLSVDRAIHDQLSGAPGAFDRVTEAMADLKLRRQAVVGVFVATRLNLSSWAETIELAVALGIDGLMFNRFNPGGRGLEHFDTLQAEPAALQAALDVAERACQHYGISIACSIAMPPCLFRTDHYQHLTFGFCSAGTERAYYAIDPLGNLRPCNHSPTILGNLREHSFGELTDTPAQRDFMQARPDLCAGCRLEQECQGGCKAAGEACRGSAWQPDPFLRAYWDQARKPT